MEIRLNKLISDSGFCSRREADKFIEAGRVTVNGTYPKAGEKVTTEDIVMLDDIRIQVGKHAATHSRVAAGKTQHLVFGTTEKKEKRERKESKPQAVSEEKKEAPKTGNSKGMREGKFVKYNKYAAARKAGRDGEKPKKEQKTDLPEEKVLKEALQPKFGKSLGRSAVAQRMAASPKSASLRKTSKNNPANKAKWAASRQKPKEE